MDEIDDGRVRDDAGIRARDEQDVQSPRLYLGRGEGVRDGQSGVRRHWRVRAWPGLTDVVERDGDGQVQQRLRQSACLEVFRRQHAEDVYGRGIEQLYGRDKKHPDAQGRCFPLCRSHGGFGGMMADVRTVDESIVAVVGHSIGKKASCSWDADVVFIHAIAVP